jgi:hypothetical protein
LGVGFLARPEEIRKFGHFTRRVRRISSPALLHISFAKAVKGETMARVPLEQRRGKRSQESEDWMEEDDLLGGDL